MLLRRLYDPLTLVYGGYVELGGSEGVQGCRIERLGVLSEVMLVLAVLPRIGVPLLNIILAWFTYSMRGCSISILAGLGVSRPAFRFSSAIIAVLVVVVVSTLGVLVAELINPPVILGYPLRVYLEGYTLLAYVTVQVSLYMLGLLSGELGED